MPPAASALTTSSADGGGHLTDPEIAAALFVSPRTVEVHVAHLLAKLGVANRRAAIALAARSGPA